MTEEVCTLESRAYYFGDWRDKFLAAVTDGASITAAADLVGKARRAVYTERENTSKFAEAWEVAVRAGEQVRIDQADNAMHSRHVNGVEKPVTYQGEITDHYIEYDTAAGKAWLAAHDPRYRKAEQQGSGGVQLVIHLDGHGLLQPPDNQGVIESTPTSE